MKNIYKVLLLLIILCFSCKQEESMPKIEIYLLKNRIQTYEGVPTLQVKDSIADWLAENNMLDSRYDTVREEIIHAGKFKISPDDIQPKPFLTDLDVLFLDVNRQVLTLDSVGATKFYNMERKFREGTQFVITVDKHPAMTGYFFPSIASFTCNTLHMYYYIPAFSYTANVNNLPLNCLQIAYGPYKKDNFGTPPYPPELIEAFRSSGRLIE